MNRFSCIDDPRKRLILIHTLTLMYNLSNMGLYIESPNEFGEHYGLIDHRLSQFGKDNAGQIVLFSTIVFFTLVLGYSNQKSYSYHIDRALGKSRPSFDLERHPLIDEPKAKNGSGKLTFATSLISGFYKATVASSSLAAFLKNTAGATSAIAVSAICAPGNFMAQFAIFAAPLDKKYHWHLSYKKRWFFAHLLTFFYNIPNVALYFNAGDEFLHHIGVLDHRLIDHEENWEYLPLVLLVVGSLFLFMSTQRSYSQKIADFFTDPDKELDSNNSQSENGWWQRTMDKLQPFFAVESRVSAVYKAVINYISLVAVLYSFTSQLVVSFVLASLCIPGNLFAQFSILKPGRSHLEKENEQLESVRSERYNCGIFSNPVAEPLVGLSLQNQVIFDV